MCSYAKHWHTPLNLSSNSWFVFFQVAWIRVGELGGVMVYDLNCNNFNFICGNSTFPLINAIRDALYAKKTTKARFIELNICFRLDLWPDDLFWSSCFDSFYLYWSWKHLKTWWKHFKICAENIYTQWGLFREIYWWL